MSSSLAFPNAKPRTPSASPTRARGGRAFDKRPAAPLDSTKEPEQAREGISGRSDGSPLVGNGASFEAGRKRDVEIPFTHDLGRDRGAHVGWRHRGAGHGTRDARRAVSLELRREAAPGRDAGRGGGFA